MRVLVVDGSERPALAAVRSLGHQGFDVTVGAEVAPSLAGLSRHCARTVKYPSPHEHRDAFDGFLLGWAQRERFDVLIPVSDVTTGAVIARQQSLSRYTAFAVPPASAFETVTDKARLSDLANRCNVPSPRTAVVESGRDVQRVMAHVRFPAVVKSFRSRIPTFDGWAGTTVHYASSASELEGLYRSVDYLKAFPSLIQERVIGPGIGLFALFDRGRLIATFAHRRLREKPPSGGVSVLRESVEPDPALVEYTNRLLAPLGWHGVAMVEFKRDRHSGRPFLIEVNGRFWGSLQLAIDSGIDFPLLVAQLAAGVRVTPASSYRVGVKSRWLLGDIDHLLLRLRPGRSDLPAGSPSRARAVVEFMKFSGRDLHYEVIRLDDPRPFMHEVKQYAGAACVSAARQIRRYVSALFHPSTSRRSRLERHARAIK